MPETTAPHTEGAAVLDPRETLPVTRRNEARVRACARGGEVHQKRSTVERPATATRPRNGCWKPAFLQALAASGNVTAACDAARIARATYYRERRQNIQFASDVRDSLATARAALEIEARKRAVDGWDEPVFFKGIQVGVIRRYSDYLLIRLLQAHLPKKYGRSPRRQRNEAPSQNPVRDRDKMYEELIARFQSDPNYAAQ